MVLVVRQWLAYLQLMARPVRIHIPHATYLVQLRAKPGEVLFADESERSRFLDSLGEAVTAGQVQVYAYSLLDTSALIFLRAGVLPLSGIIHRAQAGYFNRLRVAVDRARPLLRDRHRAILVEEGDLFLDVVRRVHLAPIIGGHWSNESEGRKWGEVSTNRWTSFPIYTAKQDCPGWFNRPAVLARFSEFHPKKPEEGFYRYIIDGVKRSGEDVLDQVVAMSLLGSAEFVERYYEGAKGRRRMHQPTVLRGSTISFETICKVVAEAFELDPGELLKPRSRHPARKYLVELSLRYALDEDGVKGLGEKLNVSGSALAHLRRTFRKQCSENPEAQKLLQTLDDHITIG
ncbi:hypothetical protein KQI63_15570 [bacterium]|nr:hypothetical protein [bacterium]